MIIHQFSNQTKSGLKNLVKSGLFSKFLLLYLCTQRNYAKSSILQQKCIMRDHSLFSVSVFSWRIYAVLLLIVNSFPPAACFGGSYITPATFGCCPLSLSVSPSLRRLSLAE